MRLGQFLGGGAAFAPQAQEGGGDLFGAELLQQLRGQGGVVAHGFVQAGMVQHALIIARPHLVRGRRV